MAVLPERHPGYTPRRSAGLTGYERALARAGLSPVAGIDEAGRGACAGPLVVAAVAFEHRKLAKLTGVADSKALTAAARERAYAEITAVALAWHVVIIESAEIDRAGLHVSNIAGMRRALAGLDCQPAYVLTDGFAVRGLGVPALAMWKGDEVAACVAAASVVAKVTRDRIMREMHLRYPEYGFARHKGYSTRSHMNALTTHGPCPEHRRSFVNVSGVICAEPGADPGGPEPGPELGGAGLGGAELDAAARQGVSTDELVRAGIPEQIGPDQMGPERMGLEQLGPEQLGPEPACLGQPGAGRAGGAGRGLVACGDPGQEN